MSTSSISSPDMGIFCHVVADGMSGHEADLIKGSIRRRGRDSQQVTHEWVDVDHGNRLRELEVLLEVGTRGEEQRPHLRRVVVVPVCRFVQSPTITFSLLFVCLVVDEKRGQEKMQMVSR